MLIGYGEVTSKRKRDLNCPMIALEALSGDTLAYHINKHKTLKANKLLNTAASLTNSYSSISNNVDNNFSNSQNFQNINMNSNNTARDVPYNNNSNSNSRLAPNIGTFISSNEFSPSPFSEHQIIKMLKEFTDALNYIHNRVHSNCSLIHRDLKPDNIGYYYYFIFSFFDYYYII